VSIDHKIKTDLVKAYDRYAQERDKLEIVHFKTVPLDENRSHFQSVILRKN